jgi:1,4-dihydroxy-2-naphthoate octaprenyltransferase
VRAILGAHAARRTGADVLPANPNALAPAPPLREALENLQREKGEAAVRAVAADYAALWARTFRTLVVHLRGRPERALSLFAEEVYPFLRGDRLAARVEAVAPGRARLILAPGLPDAYLAGLAEAFAGLSRARASCTALGNGLFEVRYKVEGADRLARLSQNLASLRVPLLVAALLSMLLGIVLASREVGALEPWRVAATLLGGLAAQAAANALHDRNGPHPAGLLGPVRLSARALRAVQLSGYALAGALGLLLAIAAPAVLAFAVAGLVVSVLFGRFRQQGYGPVLAGVTYGPLMAEGALYAVAPAAQDHALNLLLSLATLPLGALAAAILYLDDLADRPLDEAGGQRTLLVRLPRRIHLAGYVTLLAGGLGALLLVLDRWAPAAQPLAVALALPAAALALTVRRNLDDPHGLGPARLGTLALLVATAALLTLSLVPT